MEGVPASETSPETHPAHFFLPVRDRDASVELVLPAASTEAAEAGSAKRQRCEPAAAAAAAAAAAVPPAADRPQAAAIGLAEHIILLPSSTHLLKSTSPKFCAALERWSGEHGGNKLRFECGSEQEAASWGHLLDCIHSMGRQLPADLEAVLRLLLLAREQAAEPVVAACLRELHAQADQLSAASCLELLTHLETGVSEHEPLRVLGTRLLSAAGQRLSQLLAEDAAIRGNAAVQAQLLSYLGPLQHMLNDTVRRDLFIKLPFEVLRDCIFEDRNVRADAEVTVLAAFAHWAEHNVPENLDQAGTEQVVTICSRIRFPRIPADMLQNYWDCWAFPSCFDPSGEILTRALVAASSPVQLEIWQNFANLDNGEDEEAGGSLTAAQFVAKCGSWWQPRQPQLAAHAEAAVFEIQLTRDDGAVEVQSAAKYWQGCWWACLLCNEADGNLGVYIIPAMCQGHEAAFSGPKVLAYGMLATCTVTLCGKSCSWSQTGARWFMPWKGYGSGWSSCEVNGQPLTWEAFWAEGSPWLTEGAARVRFVLEPPEELD